MFGTATRPGATRALLLGSGELGKEVAIELQRFGIEVIAADRYPNAPAMQVAHKAHVLDMLDGNALRELVALGNPDRIIPEREAIATDTLAALEQEGVKVVPNARATQLTMNREGIRPSPPRPWVCPPPPTALPRAKRSLSPRSRPSACPA